MIDNKLKHSSYYDYDELYHKQGYKIIAGLDEAGRGC